MSCNSDDNVESLADLEFEEQFQNANFKISKFLQKDCIEQNK